MRTITFEYTNQQNSTSTPYINFEQFVHALSAPFEQKNKETTYLLSQINTLNQTMCKQQQAFDSVREEKNTLIEAARIKLTEKEEQIKDQQSLIEKLRNQNKAILLRQQKAPVLKKPWYKQTSSYLIGIGGFALGAAATFGLTKWFSK